MGFPFPARQPYSPRLRPWTNGSPPLYPDILYQILRSLINSARPDTHLYENPYGFMKEHNDMHYMYKWRSLPRLAELRLVSRAWRDVATPIIVEHVSLSKLDRLADLAQFLGGTIPVGIRGVYVWRLDLRVDMQDLPATSIVDETISNIKKIISHCARLEIFQIIFFPPIHWDYKHAISGIIQTLVETASQTLRRIDWLGEGAEGPSQDDIAVLVTQFPRLKSLEVYAGNCLVPSGLNAGTTYVNNTISTLVLPPPTVFPSPSDIFCTVASNAHFQSLTHLCSSNSPNIFNRDLDGTLLSTDNHFFDTHAPTLKSLVLHRGDETALEWNIINLCPLLERLVMVPDRPSPEHLPKEHPITALLLPHKNLAHVQLVTEYDGHATMDYLSRVFEMLIRANLPKLGRIQNICRACCSSIARSHCEWWEGWEARFAGKGIRLELWDACMASEAEFKRSAKLLARCTPGNPIWENPAYPKKRVTSSRTSLSLALT